MSSISRESSSMSLREASLLKKWKEIEALEYDDENVSEQEFSRCKESWFVEAFLFFQELPPEEHCWCEHHELAWPLLEPFYSFYDVSENKSVKALWRRFSQELCKCTRCVLQYYKAKEFYATEFLEDVVGTLLAVLQTIDEERVASYLHDIMCKMKNNNLNSEKDSDKIICVLFEIMRFPVLLEDAEIDSLFVKFLQYVENTFDLSLAADQCYAGVYALLFHNDQATRRIALRLAGAFGKLRTAVDLEPIQPVLQRHMHCLEFDLFDSKKIPKYKWNNVDFETTKEPPSSPSVKSRPRTQCTRESLWIGLKTLLGLLEPAAFEEGVVEKYPFLLGIVLNHASEASPVFWNALHCLKLLLDVLGYKLWIKTTFSPGVMRSTLIGQCFHTHEEKMHKAIFDLFQPFLQSLEALEDGEYERQRRNILYFLLQQVGHSRNFSRLMSKKACQISFFIILRGFKMDPACPPMECVHMWGPSLLDCAKDIQLYDSLRQPALQLLETIIIADSVVLSHLHCGGASKRQNRFCHEVLEQLEEVIDSKTGEYPSYLKEHKLLDKLVDSYSKWLCAPILWVEILEKALPSDLPESFSQAVLWASSRMCSVSLNELKTREVQQYQPEVLESINATLQSSLVWEAPKGCDDGGDGKLCSNSLVAQDHNVKLLLFLKRCVETFVGQIQLTRVSGNWIWDPYIAEVLVLVCQDSYEKIRDFGRYVLAHFAKNLSLESGLSFLCSTQASAECLIRGLFYAIKLLMMSPFQETVTYLQNLLFLARKVVTFWQAESCHPVKKWNDSAIPGDGGGFLRQPDYDQYSQANNNIKMKEDDLQQERNLQKVSSILWPLLLKVMKDGHPHAEDPAYMTLFTRLFDLLPSVLQNILVPIVELDDLKDLIERTICDPEFSWISSLLEWGHVSIVSIHRRWKFAVSAILIFLRNANCLKESDALNEVHVWLETGTSFQMQTKDKLETLLHMALPSATKNIKCSYPKREPSVMETMPDENRGLNLELKTHVMSKTVAVESSRVQDVIVLSDDESECMPDDRITSQPATNVWDEKPISQGFHAHPMPGKAQTSPERKHVHPISFHKQLGSLQSVHGNKGNLDKILNSSGSKPLEFTPPERLPLPSSRRSTDIEETLSKASSAAGEIDVTDCKGSVVPRSSDSVAEEKLIMSTTPMPMPAQSHNDGLDVMLKELIQDGPNKTTVNLKSLHTGSKKGLGLVSNPQPKRQLIQLHIPNEHSKGNITKLGITARAPVTRLDDWYKRILTLDYFSVVGLSSDTDTEASLAEPILKVPLVFRSSQHYMDVFRPLVLEEFRAQLQQSYDQLNFTDGSTAGVLRLMSLEKVDDFDYGRFTSEAGADGPARSSFENDLLLLSRQPFPSCRQSVHMIGKVERQEHDNKSRSVIILLKFYLRSGNKRLAKIRTLLLERSKWHATRLISITPQLREFQALSAVECLPLLPIILNDGPNKVGPLTTKTACRQVMQELPEKLDRKLRADYNISQMQSIHMALRSAVVANGHELSLVQGPPGTGKTRTILAVVSVLIGSIRNSNKSTYLTKSDHPIKESRPVSKSVAIARCWQAAALAKQQLQEEYETVHKDGERRARILVCAQSNAAVDELVCRICKDGLYDSNGDCFKPFVVRVGNAKNVHPNCLPVFIDTLVEDRMDCDNENAGRLTTNKSSTEVARKKLHKILDDIQVLEAKLTMLQNTDTQSKMDIGEDSVSETDDSEEDLKLKLNMLHKQRRQTYTELAALEAGEKRSLEEARRRRLELKRDIIRRAEIVVATLSGCGGDVYSACVDNSGRRRQLRHLDDGLFDAVVIDEAAQALEPTTLIPLQLLKTSYAKCIMVGDPKQLPATVISQIASKLSFKCSLFERLQKGGLPVSLLTVQYRMHPEICEFPSAYFYENQLEDGKRLREERKAVFHEDKYLGPYVIFDVADGYEKVGHQSTSQSLCNEAEVAMVLEIFKNLETRYPSEVKPGRIGVITPYQQQLSLLRERCRRCFGQTVMQGIEFNTVDGFQGREVDILIFSTVRAKSRTVQNSSRIGFVADVRRMNVALTRARFSLWIVCNADTLQGSAPWASLLENAKERGLLHRVKSPYRNLFERGCSDLGNPGREQDWRGSLPMMSDAKESVTKKHTEKIVVREKADSTRRPSARTDFAEKLLLKADKGMDTRNNPTESKFHRRNHLPDCKTNRDKSVSNLLDEKTQINSESNLGCGNSDSKKPSEHVSVMDSDKERGHQIRSNKSPERRSFGIDYDQEVTNIGRKKYTGASEQSFNRNLKKHGAKVRFDQRQTLEQKQIQGLKSRLQDVAGSGGPLPENKDDFRDMDSKVGTRDKSAIKCTDFGASHHHLPDREGVSSPAHGCMDNKTLDSPLETFYHSPKDVESNLNVGRPSKRSRLVTSAGLTSSNDLQTSNENPSMDVGELVGENHAEELGSRSNNRFNEEWILFLEVLSNSKINFPLP